MYEEKIKLITLSVNSWHYKLIKFMFDRIIPNPENLQNLCPYFWILVASLLFLPITGPFILIFKTFNSIYKYFNKKINEKITNKAKEWAKNLTHVEAYDLFENRFLRYKSIDRPAYTTKVNNFLLMQSWATAQGIEIDENEKWLSAVEKLLKKHRADYIKLVNEQKAIRALEYEKREQRNIKAKERQEKLYNSFSFVTNFFIYIKSLFIFKNYNAIIKTAKKIVGLLITLIMAGISFFIVHVLLFCIMFLIKIWNWPDVMNGLIVVGAILIGGGIVYCLAWGILRFSAYAIEKYNKGNMGAFLTLLIYPLIGISYLFKYLIYYPLFFIFVSFLYKLILIDILFGILKGLKVGLINSTGIFGKYFGATKSDYCPSVEWEK